MRWTIAGVVGVLLAGSPSFTLTPVHAQGTGRVRGAIFDSLSSRPLTGATVLISGSERIGVTDDRGRFDIDSIAAGKRTLTFSTPSLDSLGLFTLGRDVVIVAGQTVDLALNTPSFATVWKSLCPRTPSLRGDSGIVYGSIINAANEQRLEGARVFVSWFAIASNGTKVSMDRPVSAVRTDSTGNYYACGVSADMMLTVDIEAGALAAGIAEVQLGASRVSRRDFLVSTELRTPLATPRATTRTGAPSLPVSARARGTATLRGLVRDARGAPVGNALVTLPSADTSARSDADGRFTVGLLPAGSQLVRVLRLGHGPLTAQVDLRPNQIVDALFDLPPATVLPKVNVVADREVGLRQRAFDERRGNSNGFGHYIDATQLRGQSDVTTSLRTVPSLVVQRRGFDTSVMIMRGGVGCTPTIFLDGRRSSLDELRVYAPSDMYGIEVYNSAQTTPSEFITPGFSNCGVIVVWTKLGRR